ncbi:MAG: hypothetical protein FJY80_01900 [Candidatus Aminicenantes bacterium]|nr:hypothetical protein [Candidatus Aminicenantes bacterium]
MSKKLALLAAGALVLAAAAQDAKETVYKFREKEDIKKVFAFPDASRPGSLTVDNLFGTVEVQGEDRKDIELTAVKTVRAKGPEKLGRGKAEVVLDIKTAGNDIDIYVDGPFRCQVQGCQGIRWRDWGYEVKYDFVLKVPRKTSVTLKTVNEGRVAARDVEGDFDLRNVNGEVVLEAMAGAGTAQTVNGEVRAAFVRNPGAACSFKTVNGDVTLTFREGLGADFRLKTMHGEAYSDFPTAALPAEPVKRETVDGLTTYRRGGFTGARVGKGGPEIRCDTMNGDIYIKKNG